MTPLNLDNLTPLVPLEPSVPRTESRLAAEPPAPPFNDELQRARQATGGASRSGDSHASDVESSSVQRRDERPAQDQESSTAAKGDDAPAVLTDDTAATTAAGNDEKDGEDPNVSAAAEEAHTEAPSSKESAANGPERGNVPRGDAKKAKSSQAPVAEESETLDRSHRPAAESVPHSAAAAKATPRQAGAAHAKGPSNDLESTVEDGAVDAASEKSPSKRLATDGVTKSAEQAAVKNGSARLLGADVSEQRSSASSAQNAASRDAAVHGRQPVTPSETPTRVAPERRSVRDEKDKATNSARREGQPAAPTVANEAPRSVARIQPALDTSTVGSSEALEAPAESTNDPAETVDSANPRAATDEGAKEIGSSPWGDTRSQNTPNGTASHDRLVGPLSPDGKGHRGVDPARFVRRVARALETAAHREGELRLRLSPPELGSVRLHVTLSEGALSAKIEAETQAARTALVDNLPVLRERLAEHGIKIEHFDVHVSDDAQRDATAWQDDQSQNGERELLHPRTRRGTEAGESPVSTPLDRYLPRIDRDHLNVVI